MPWSDARTTTAAPSRRSVTIAAMSKDAINDTRASGAGCHVALLRGINVGGKNTLLMKDLVAMFIQAGCSAVRTYIQSGNVVFRAPPRIAKGIAATVSDAIEDASGLRVPVVLRTAEELRAVAESHPLLKAGVEPRTLQVVFLADEPSRTLVEALDAARSPKDSFTVRGREVYLHCPEGVGRSKLTNGYFDSTLRTTSTMRSWKTVLKLAELTAAP